jgi:hypothetical protein
VPEPLRLRGRPGRTKQKSRANLSKTAGRPAQELRSKSQDSPESVPDRTANPDGRESAAAEPERAQMQETKQKSRANLSKTAGRPAQELRSRTSYRRPHRAIPQVGRRPESSRSGSCSCRGRAVWRRLRSSLLLRMDDGRPAQELRSRTSYRRPHRAIPQTTPPSRPGAE